MKSYGRPQPTTSKQPHILFFVLIILAAAFSYLLTGPTFSTGLGSVLLLMFAATGFLWPEAGLYIVAFSMLLSPEITVGAIGGARATLERGITLRLEDFLLVSVGLGWLVRSATSKSGGLFRQTPLNAPIAAYILVCVVATLWGMINGHVEGLAGFFFVLKYIEYVVIYFMVVNYLDTNQAKTLLLCMFITAFVVCLYGLAQIPSGGRITAPFEGEAGEPNTLGGYLILVGAVAAALFENIKLYRSRLGLGVLLGLIVVNLLYTESRSSYLAVIPTVLALTYFSRWKLFLVGALAVAIALGPVILPDIARQRLAFTFTQPEEPGQIRVGGLRIDTSTSARIESWWTGLKDWWKSVLLGYGVTGHIFMDAQFPRVLAETGIVGILSFLWLVYAFFQLGLDTWRTHTDPFTRALAAGFTAGLAGLLTHALGANTFIIVRIMEPFWALAGILFVLSSAPTTDVSPQFELMVPTIRF